MAKRSPRSKASSASSRSSTTRRGTTQRQGGATIGVLLLALVVGAVRLLGGRATLPDLTGMLGPAATIMPPAGQASRDTSAPANPAGRDASVPSDRQQDQGDPTGANARTILDGLNAARADAGVGALSSDVRLAAAALAHSRDMASSGRCSHDGTDGSDTETRLRRAGYAPAAYGEIIACRSKSPAEALGQWQRSDAHRTIVLDGRYRQAGVGITMDGRDGPVWVVTFGAER